MKHSYLNSVSSNILNLFIYTVNVFILFIVLEYFKAYIHILYIRSARLQLIEMNIEFKRSSVFH